MILNERTINILESIKVPNFYWKTKTEEYQYWFRSLLQKIDSSIIFNDLPKGWSDDFLHICLYALGYVAVFKPNSIQLGKKGLVVFNPAVLSGYDFYYQPTTATVSNPNLPAPFSSNFVIGRDCELIKLTPDYCGIFDILDYYSSKLAELSKGIDVGILNTKMPIILTASSDSQAETLKKIYDKVQSGESLVVWKDEVGDDEIIPRKDPFESFFNDFTKTYIIHNLLEDMQTILDSFYCEIGLPVAIEKKERLITSEADFASAQSQARISCWIETLRESLDKVNTLFNTNITCEVAYERTDNPDRNSDGSDES